MKNRNEKPEIEKINRREFLKMLAATGSVAVGGTLLAGCGTSAPGAVPGSSAAAVTLDLALPENQSLAVVGGSLTLGANDLDPKGILLYRSSESSVLAFSRKCTHMGCTVGEFQSGVASCPCHGSQFDTSGKPVKGPAQNPLPAYAATLSGSTLTIKK
jgi:Rieske Fe-S protein